MACDTSSDLGVEADHAQRIRVLPADQIRDAGFIIGAVEIGLRKRRAEPAVMTTM